MSAFTAALRQSVEAESSVLLVRLNVWLIHTHTETDYWAFSEERAFYLIFTQSILFIYYLFQFDRHSSHLRKATDRQTDRQTRTDTHTPFSL